MKQVEYENGTMWDMIAYFHATCTAVVYYCYGLAPRDQPGLYSRSWLCVDTIRCRLYEPDANASRATVASNKLPQFPHHTYDWLTRAQL